jgi:polar amino acid transport system substrate-binding protein
MKPRSAVLLVPLLALATASCAGVAPDPVWDRIESSGRIVIGTSADYAPFEYYDEAFQITGFDAAIARELGVRLGVEVELVDIAFDGLGPALQIGQIDAAIAAISVTPERQATADFTNVYYAGKASALANESSAVEPILTPPQLAQYRVGVQRGTVYETWLQTNLVDTGLMPASNLLAYETPEHAVSDLKQNRNDVVVMDAAPAEDYLLEGGVRLVGQGINPQLFAIALPKGASTLQARLNEALTEMQNDGTVLRYAKEYLEVDVLEELPVAASTPVPGPTAVPPACYDGMEFVEDVTVPDGTEMAPGENFDKVWRIRNIGTCTWNSSYSLAFVQGDQMGGDTVNVAGSVSSGATYDITIDQTAPDSPGTYGGVWEMRNGNGVFFGEALWVEIVVSGAPAPTAVPPAATGVPPIAPTAVPAPIIEFLVAEPSELDLGGTVTISWAYSGQDLASATLMRTEPNGSVITLPANVNPGGTYQDVPPVAGLVSYTLTVNSASGGTAVQTVVVQVYDPSLEVNPQ